MVAGETAGVVEPPFGVVGTDVIAVPLPKLLNRIFNGSENRNDKIPSEILRSIIIISQVNTMMCLTLTLIHRLPSSPLC